MGVALATAAGGAADTTVRADVVGQAGKDVVWVPTPPETVERMLDVAKVTPQDYVMDLGSGDGRNIIAAAKRGATALGVEYNPDMVELSKRNAAAAGVAGKATFVQGDMYEADISKANVMALFLLPSNMVLLRPKFFNLAPGSRIVSNTFGMEGWTADYTETRARLQLLVHRAALDRPGEGGGHVADAARHADLEAGFSDASPARSAPCRSRRANFVARRSRSRSAPPSTPAA